MKIIFVRHGEPTYESVKDLGLVSYLAELTSKGLSQAYEVSRILKDSGAELIISSPYTRALQTAAIISKETGISMIVDPLIHEWVEDTTHLNTLDETHCKAVYNEFIAHNGKQSSDTIYGWENIDHVAKRAYGAMQRYHILGCQKIIVVSHAMLIRTFGYNEPQFPYCGIFEKEFDENTKFEGLIPWKRKKE